MSFRSLPDNEPSADTLIALLGVPQTPLHSHPLQLCCLSRFPSTVHRLCDKFFMSIASFQRVLSLSVNLNSPVGKLKQRELRREGSNSRPDAGPLQSSAGMGIMSTSCHGVVGLLAVVLPAEGNWNRIFCLPALPRFL
jgi:hypothetical protein